MHSAYNPNPLEEQLRRITQFVIGKQQYEFDTPFHSISIGPAEFSAVRSKIFRPLILSKSNYIISRCFHTVTNKTRQVPLKYVKRKHESSLRYITFFP